MAFPRDARHGFLDCRALKKEPPSNKTGQYSN